MESIIVPIIIYSLCALALVAIVVLVPSWGLNLLMEKTKNKPSKTSIFNQIFAICVSIGAALWIVAWCIGNICLLVTGASESQAISMTVAKWAFVGFCVVGVVAGAILSRKPKKFIEGVNNRKSKRKRKENKEDNNKSDSPENTFDDSKK